MVKVEKVRLHLSVFQISTFPLTWSSIVTSDQIAPTMRLVVLTGPVRSSCLRLSMRHSCAVALNLIVRVAARARWPRTSLSHRRGVR
jgi:hypothetical protein